MKRTLVVCLLLAGPFIAYGAQVCIWNFDASDTYYDAQVGTTVNCAYWLEQTLSGNGHTVQTVTTLPADLSSYDVIYVTLGWYRC